MNTINSELMCSRTLRVCTGVQRVFSARGLSVLRTRYTPAHARVPRTPYVLRRTRYACVCGCVLYVDAIACASSRPDRKIRHFGILRTSRVHRHLYSRACVATSTRVRACVRCFAAYLPTQDYEVEYVSDGANDD